VNLKGQGGGHIGLYLDGNMLKSVRVDIWTDYVFFEHYLVLAYYIV